MVDHGQAVGEGLGIGEFVGDEDGGDGPVHDQKANQVGERAAQARVQARVGLVEEQRVAVGKEQAAERHPVCLGVG